MSQAGLKDQSVHVCVPNAPITIIDIMNLPYSHVTNLWLAAAIERKTLGGCLLADSLQKQQVSRRRGD
jgi:hypothetical protein